MYTYIYTYIYNSDGRIIEYHAYHLWVVTGYQGDVYPIKSLDTPDIQLYEGSITITVPVMSVYLERMNFVDNSYSQTDFDFNIYIKINKNYEAKFQKSPC